ncbi:MAG TPA: GAF domain-containing protein [Methylomirabilota bacterium]|nr:GAF domain-containing protein [Methylomirabilota bacterium]
MDRELRARLRETETLLRVSQALGTTLDLTEALRRVSRETARTLGADMVGAFLADADQRTLHPIAGYHVPKELRDELSQFPVPIEGSRFFAEAWAARAPVATADAAADPRVSRELRERFRFRSALFGPMMALGLPIGGLLAVWSSREHHATPEELRLVEAIGRQAGLAIDNARLYADSEQRRREAELMAELGRALNASLDLGTVLQRIAVGARDLCGSDMAWIALRDPVSGAMVYRHWVGARREGYERFSVEAGKGLGGQVLLTGRALRTDNYAADLRITQDYLTLARAEGIVAQLAVPIRIGERIEGLLYVDNCTPRPFTDRDEAILTRLAEHAAIAIQNARLYEETERRRKTAEVLAEVGRLLPETLDAAVVGQRIADSVRGLLGARGSTLYRLSESGELDDLATSGDAFPRGTGLVDVAFQTRAPVVAPDLLADPRAMLTAESQTRLQVSAHRAVLAVPLTVQDRVIGALAVADRTGRAFDDDEVRLARTFADQAAVALENARLFEELGERLRETETLLAVAQILSRNLSAPEVMRRVSREVAHAFQADMVGAYFLDPRIDALIPIAGYRVPRELLPRFLETPFPLSRFGLLEDAWKTGKPVWTSDFRRDDRMNPAFLADIRPRSLLFAPTPVRGEMVGGLFLAWWETARAFTPAELRLIEGIASQVGLALENADLLRQTGEKLQEAETLLSVSRGLSSTLDLQSLLRHFLRHVARTIEADSVGVWLVDPASGHLEPVAGYRVPPETVKAAGTYRIDPAESPFYAEGIASRRVLVSTDVPADTRIPETLKAIAPHRAQLFGPIVARDRVVGAFIAVWWDRARQFTDRERALVEAMGSQAGIAVENARLFQAHARKLDELSVLYEVSRAVTGQLDLGGLIQTVHEQVSRIFDTRNMVILLYDPAAGEFEVALRLFEGQPDPNPVRRYPVGVGLMTRVVEDREAIRTADYAAACRAEGVEPVPTSASLPHWLGVPMLAGDEILGVVALRDRSRPFTDADERLLANIAGVAALALRSVRLFAEKTRAHDELRAAQDQLVRSEKLRAVGEMAAGVAHDFNNTLAAIMGRAQLLLSQIEEPGQRRQLQIIEQAAIDGARTVRRIQEFTRMRRARPFELVDLNHLVGEVVEVTRSRWKDEALGQGISYEVRVDATPVPMVGADPSELREVLINLVLNALDAMPDGGEIRVRTGVEGEQVVCVVADTGIGMTEAVRQRIFDPFFTTKAEKGTGLGLSVAYGIVTRHGGEIDVRSEPWRGSSFTIRLPVARGLPERLAKAATAAAPRSARILLIDDEEHVRQVLADILSSQGHAVTASADGRAGLSRLHEEPFDLVFTDLGMPGLSGWEVARLAKLRRPEAIVVLVTGWSDLIDADEAQRRGVDYVLAKPFEMESVRAVVGQALSSVWPVVRD